MYAHIYIYRERKLANWQYKISNEISTDYSKNHSRINKNHQNTLLALKTIQYDINRNDKNKENMRKPASTKRVYMVREN